MIRSAHRVLPTGTLLKALTSEKLAGTKCKLREIAKGGPQGFPNGNESGIADISNSSGSKPEEVETLLLSNLLPRASV